MSNSSLKGFLLETFKNHELRVYYLTTIIHTIIYPK